MNAIVPVAMSMQDLQILADAIAKSNLFGMKNKDQALVLMMLARSEGRDPVEAARDYDIIQGKPAKKAEAMLRDFLAAGGKVEWHELSDMKADATFKHPQTGTVRIDWDLARANTAGFGGKEMWRKFPRQMLRSRVVSEGVRTLWPLATSGMYVPEEQADIERKDEHNGPTIESTASDAREQMNRDVPLKAAAADMPRPPRVTEPPPGSTPRRTIGQLLEAVRVGLNNASSRVEVDRILDAEDVLKLRANVAADSPAIIRLDAMRDEALERHLPMPDEDEELGEIEIAGEDKVAAG